MRSVPLYVLLLVTLIAANMTAIRLWGQTYDRWEYKVIDLSTQIPQVEKVLNQLGQQGWELQRSVDVPVLGRVILRRKAR